MAEPIQPRTTKWLWPAILAILIILLIAILFNPTGDPDEVGVQDPIVTGDIADPTANGAGAVGDGLPQPGDAPPVNDGAPGAGMTADPLPAN